ncbi:MAG: hypothetical protein NWE77_06200 [Candidatus Bathyarchaeota archaeon]|nr:hypothetical protein [Candidatus Bathyarchaeota archaeon]
MRSYSVLVVFALAFVALLGVQFLSWQSVEAAIPVSVDIEPDTLNLEMLGLWITVYVEPPDEYFVSDINMSTVKLEGVLLPVRWDIQDDKLMLKFPAEDVISLIWLEIYHMGKPMPQDNILVELTVTGEFGDGVAFEGSDEIQVIAPSF